MLDCEKCNSSKCGPCSYCLNQLWKKRCSNKHKCPRLIALQSMVKNSKVEAIKTTELNPELENVVESTESEIMVQTR